MGAINSHFHCSLVCPTDHHTKQTKKKKSERKKKKNANPGRKREGGRDTRRGGREREWREISGDQSIDSGDENWVRNGTREEETRSRPSEVREQSEQGRGCRGELMERDPQEAGERGETRQGFEGRKRMTAGNFLKLAPRSEGGKTFWREEEITRRKSVTKSER